MRARLLLTYLTLAVLVLAALEVPLGVTYSRNELQDLETKVERDAVAVASLSEGALERSGETSLTAVRALARRYRWDTGGRVVVVDSTGTAVADSEPAPGGTSFGSRPEFAQALKGKVATGTRHSNTLGADLLYVAVPVASGGEDPRRRPDHVPDLGRRRAGPPLLAEARRDRRDRARRRGRRRALARPRGDAAAAAARGGGR